MNEFRDLLQRSARPHLANAISGVRICSGEYAAPPVTSTSGTVLAPMARGGKRLALGDRTFDYGAGDYLAAPAGLPVTGHVVGAALGRPTLGFVLDPAGVADLVGERNFPNGPPSLPMGADPNRRGNSRRWIVTAVEESLRRLGTDHLDIYLLHRPDPAVAIEETLSALTDLIRQGKIRAAGSSTFPASGLVDAHWAAERRGLEPLRVEQPPYSILNRSIEREVLPVVRRHGMGTRRDCP
jgi:hypothetical protein